MDPFKEITTFVNVAQRGSLSAAARHEGLAPAMIGRRLDSLETRLGVKLIQRTTRRLTLTPEGIAFLEDCQRILRELEDAESAVSARGKQATGHLRITAPAGFGRAHVAPLVPRFVTEHPRLAVSLELSDRIADLVAEGFDCAVRFGEQADSQLVRVKIGESRRVVVAQSGYLKQHGTPMRPADLAQHRCLTFGEGTAPQRGWSFVVNGAPVVERVAGPLACNDGAVLHDWTLAGMGLAWRSLWEVGDDLAAGRLVTVLDDCEAPPTSVDCLFPARKHLPLRVRLFVDFLRAEFAQEKMARILNGPVPVPPKAPKRIGRPRA
jgi:DNA-binding transcriptional LysR family regulator